MRLDNVDMYTMGDAGAMEVRLLVNLNHLQAFLI